MPARILREEILTSESYWIVSDEAKILFFHLIVSVDDTARYTGQNFSLRTRCFPGRSMEAPRMEALLSELADQDLIRLYEVKGMRYIFLPRFKQRLRYINSKYPEPPEGLSDLVIKKTDSKQAETPKEDQAQESHPSPDIHRHIDWGNPYVKF